MTMRDCRYEVAETVTSRRVGEHLVLFDLQSGTTFGLNEVGEAVWAMIEDGMPVAAICERLMADYEVAAEDLARDVEALVNELLARNLIVADPAP